MDALQVQPDGPWQALGPEGQERAGPHEADDEAVLQAEQVPLFGQAQETQDPDAANGTGGCCCGGS